MWCGSERKTGDAVGARGWGDEKNSQKQRGVRFAGLIILISYFTCDYVLCITEDEEDEDESGEFESYCSDDNIRATAGNRADNGAGGAHLDDLFDRTLEEYGSDDMGDLEDEVIGFVVIFGSANLIIGPGRRLKTFTVLLMSTKKALY